MAFTPNPWQPHTPMEWLRSLPRALTALWSLKKPFADGVAYTLTVMYRKHLVDCGMKDQPSIESLVDQLGIELGRAREDASWLAD